MNSDSGNVNTDSGKSLKSVHLQPESLFTLNQNGCSRSSGMGVHNGPEYAQEWLLTLLFGGFLMNNPLLTDLFDQLEKELNRLHYNNQSVKQYRRL